MKLSTDNKTNPLEQLSTILTEDLDSVNRIILDRMKSDVPLIPELASHLIAAGGKRIRPLLTLASAALFDYEGDRQHKLAAAVEFIHTATLLHDDVVDDSDKRRGKSSANAVFGNDAAVLVGDFLFSRSFQLMVEDGSIDILKILSDASAVIAEGEIMQLSIANDLSVTEEQYFEIANSKTATLFAAACEVGARVAGRSEDECCVLRNYGHNLGVAYQVSDDVLDYQANEVKLGKSIGDDFKEGKITLPIIRAMNKANQEEKDFLKKCFVDLNQNDCDLEQVTNLLTKYDCLNSSLNTAVEIAEKGIADIERMPKNDISDCLKDIIFFAAKREY